eukprot:scaffold89107_cov50-Attheya_sp.AAC.1
MQGIRCRLLPCHNVSLSLKIIAVLFLSVIDREADAQTCTINACETVLNLGDLQQMVDTGKSCACPFTIQNNACQDTIGNIVPVQIRNTTILNCASTSALGCRIDCPTSHFLVLEDDVSFTLSDFTLQGATSSSVRVAPTFLNANLTVQDCVWERYVAAILLRV